MLIFSFKNKYIIFIAALFSPRHSSFFIKFPFSCVQLIYCLYRLNLNICLHNDLCKECQPSLLSVSIPNRCKLAETTSISQNCNEIYLKTPKSGRNARVFTKLYAKVDKSAQFELKNTFLFFCKNQLISRSKTRCL